MTKNKRVFGWWGGGLVGAGIFVITVIYAMGGQGRTVKFNTQRINRIEHNMEKRFDRIDEKLDKLIENY